MNKVTQINPKIAVIPMTQDADKCATVCQALRAKGLDLTAITPDGKQPKSWSQGMTLKPDQTGADAYRSLVMICDETGREELVGEPTAKEFVTSFFKSHKPVTALGAAVGALSDMDLLEDRQVCADQKITEKLTKRGTVIQPGTLMTDRGLTTATTDVDLNQFAAKAIEEAKEGVHAGQHA